VDHHTREVIKDEAPDYFSDTEKTPGTDAKPTHKMPVKKSSPPVVYSPSKESKSR
jgi:hypothetical protein